MTTVPLMSRRISISGAPGHAVPLHGRKLGVKLVCLLGMVTGNFNTVSMEANLGKLMGFWYGIEPGDVCHVCQHVSQLWPSFPTLVLPLFLVGFCRYSAGGGFLVPLLVVVGSWYRTCTLAMFVDTFLYVSTCLAKCFNFGTCRYSWWEFAVTWWWSATLVLPLLVYSLWRYYFPMSLTLCWCWILGTAPLHWWVILIDTLAMMLSNHLESESYICLL